MFRRIELINHNKHDIYDSVWGYQSRDYKSGIMGLQTDAIADEWVYKLRGPQRRTLPANCRFYFTELGWKEVGRNVIRQCIKDQQEYRILIIKETDAQVVWRDKHTKYEVAVQPKKKKE